MIDIDWSKAPEGTTHHIGGIGRYMEGWCKIKDKGYYFIRMGSEGDNWIGCDNNGSPKNSETLTPIPVITQEMPNVGFKLKYQHEFIDDSPFKYLSDEFYGWENGDNLEIITKRVDSDGYVVAIVLNTQQDVLSTAALQVEFFKPIDNRTSEEKAEADMIEHLTNEGIVTYDPIMLRILISKYKAGKIHGVTFTGSK